jgi:type II secretory pathway pseudopilin PulG
MRKYISKHAKESGDTIVEVLIVLAVLSLAFVISYATANRGLLEARNADEHSEALGYIDSQVEELRADFAAGDTNVTPTPANQVFCMDSSGTYTPFIINNNPLNPYTPAMLPTSSNADSIGGYTEYPGACMISTEPYHESISYVTQSPTGQVYPTGQSYFDFLVRWDGVGNLGPQQEELTYKLNAIALTGGGYIDGTGPGGCSSGCGPTYTQNWIAYASGWQPYEACLPQDPNDTGLVWEGCNGPDPNPTTTTCVGYPSTAGTCAGMVAYRQEDAPYYFVPSSSINGSTYVMQIYYNQYGGQPSQTVANDFQFPTAGFSVPSGGYNFNVNICAPVPTNASLNLNTNCIPGQLPVDTTTSPTSQYAQACYQVVITAANLGEYGAQNYPAIQINWTNNNSPPGGPTYWDPGGTPPIDPNLEIDYISLANFNGTGVPGGNTCNQAYDSP